MKTTTQCNKIFHLIWIYTDVICTRIQIHLILFHLNFCVFFFSLLLFYRLADFCGWLNSMHMSLIRIRKTVCNRTWFGDIGKTYEMEIDKPNALPFVCHLNFTAPGDSHGDLIQVSISNHSRFQFQFQFHFMFRLFRYKRILSIFILMWWNFILFIFRLANYRTFFLHHLKTKEYFVSWWIIILLITLH